MHRRLQYLLLLIALIFCAPLFAQTPFAGTMKLSGAYGEADGNPVYDLLPITIECRAKLDRKTGYNILIANGLKMSDRHWEIFTAPNSGFFSAYLPGCKPAEIQSKTDIVNGKWHYLAMTFDGTTVKLYVDGKEVANQKTQPNKSFADVGALTFGYYPGIPPAGDTEIDEVRISRVLRAINGVPAEPFKLDADTMGLWHFDEKSPDGGYQDLSLSHNPIRVMPLPPPDDGVQTGKTRWSDMDFGPFFTSTLGATLPPGNITHKGISIRLGKEKNAAVCFDTDLLRVSVAWIGDFVKIHPGREGLAEHPDVAGTPVFGTIAGPGWAKPGTEDFTDPRKDKLGPLPKDWARYRGLYVTNERVVLSYSVGSVEILESYTGSDDQGAATFSRTFTIGPTPTPLTARICDVPGAKADAIVPILGASGARLVSGDREVLVDARKWDPVGFHCSGGEVLATFPASDKTSTYVIVIYSGKVGARRTGAAIGAGVDLHVLLNPGPPRYPQILETKGTLGDDSIANRKSEISNPYVVDTLTAPDDNPWKSFLRFSGMDFFSNGDLAVCSISGDVWVVSGIDEKLEHLKWKRFATGLHQPLGLKIVDDKVYVLGRDQITRLHDLNGDGEANFYECFNNDCKVTTNGHAYTANLETDPQGNFYYTKGADGSEHGGTILKVSKDGSKLEVFAKGVRFSNGLGVGPQGQVTEADNEGDWVPSSRIDWVREPGQFLGYTPMAHEPIAPTDPGKPICWMPKNIDNSSASQIWVTSDKWGPFKGQMLHTSYGQGTVRHVMSEVVNDQIQGGVYKFPLNFASGTMRGRFSPKDGQLYVCGLRGWQTRGAKFAALQRVRYTGKPVYMPAEIHVHKNGVRLAFTCPLDPKSVDADAFGVLQWNYRWSSSYGSRHWSVANPDRQGYDTVEVKSARLLPDGKSVVLEIPSIQRVMQMQITYNLAAADGSPVKGDVYNTIHELADPIPSPGTPGEGQGSPSALCQLFATRTFTRPSRSFCTEVWPP